MPLADNRPRDEQDETAITGRFNSALNQVSTHKELQLTSQACWQTLRDAAYAKQTFLHDPPEVDYHSNRNVYQTNSPEFEVGNGKNCQWPKKSF